MGAVNTTIFCLAYILGLLLTVLPGQVRGINSGAIVCLGLGLGAAFLLPRLWRTGSRSQVWLVAGVVGFVAVLYFNLRLPQPGERDISRLIVSSDAAPAAIFEVTGRIVSTPRMTRSQKIQFWLKAEQSYQRLQGQTASEPNSVTGKVYATVPLLQGTGLYPGQGVTVTGTLYQPQPATNPGGFDFQAYLAQKGGFAGLRGTQVVSAAAHSSPPMLWRVRQRIVRSQVQGLGVPEGPLVSAMVMGRTGVDLPYDVQDQFSASGLAHALAASGFQVSLLVGVLITLTRQLPAKARLSLGTGVVVAYIALTGIQAAVLRAGIMGCAVLFALTTERKVKPLGSLLMAATVLLLFNPLWIWDLGFQFSFLATLGLLVTVPVLVKQLDWMPSTIAPLIAVPIAAYGWTLPLQLHVFGIVSPYTILVNVLAAPLITVVSIGGMVSALAALIYPAAGSAIAWLLYYPAHGLIELAALGNQLPGSSIAVGTITAGQTIALYGLFGLVWWQSRSWRYWWVAGALGLSLVAVPVWYTHTTQFQATVLATSDDLALVIQDKGETMLVSSSSEENITFTVLPFLRQQGINQIAWAIAPDTQAAHVAGWHRLLEKLPIRTLYAQSELNAAGQLTQQNFNQTLLDRLQQERGQYLPLPLSQAIATGSMQVKSISVAPPVLELQVQNQRWLLLNHLSVEEQAHLATALPPAQVLWWSGEALLPQLVDAVKPSVAIASARSIAPQTKAELQQRTIPLYVTSQVGSVQWNPKQGFRSLLDANEQ